MADVSQVPANVRVRKSPRPKLASYDAGESVIAGDWVRIVNREVFKCDSSDVNDANAAGMCVMPGTTTDKVTIALKGTRVNVGATLTQGVGYSISNNAGKMGPTSERGSGEFVTTLGVGRSDGDLDITIGASGETVP